MFRQPATQQLGGARPAVDAVANEERSAAIIGYDELQNQSLTS
jgi:hypothetical protein